MIRNFIKYAFLSVIISLCFSVNVYSQQDDRQFSKDTARAVAKAIKAENSGEYEKALKKYEKLLNSGNLSTYERSTIYQLKGQSEYYLQSYELTASSFKKAIETGGLNENEVQALEKFIQKLQNFIDQNSGLEPKKETKPIGSFKINPDPAKSQ